MIAGVGEGRTGRASGWTSGEGEEVAVAGEMTLRPDRQAARQATRKIADQGRERFMVYWWDGVWPCGSAYARGTRWTCGWVCAWGG